jgi:hypothetical protein
MALCNDFARAVHLSVNIQRVSLIDMNTRVSLECYIVIKNEVDRSGYDDSVAGFSVLVDNPPALSQLILSEYLRNVLSLL